MDVHVHILLKECKQRYVFLQLKLSAIQDKQDLESWLSQFKTWYNQNRAHQNLNGKTPEEVWRQRRRK